MSETDEDQGGLEEEALEPDAADVAESSDAGDASPLWRRLEPSTIVFAVAILATIGVVVAATASGTPTSATTPEAPATSAALDTTAQTEATLATVAPEAPADPTDLRTRVQAYLDCLAADGVRARVLDISEGSIELGVRDDPDTIDDTLLNECYEAHLDGSEITVTISEFDLEQQTTTTAGSEGDAGTTDPGESTDTTGAGEEPTTDTTAP